MDSFPKWQKPKWLGQLTLEKIQSMSNDQIYELLLELLHHTKQLPESPEKKFLVKLGYITLAAQKIKMRRESATEEENQQLEKKMEEAMEMLCKLMVMSKARDYAKEVVEITEDEQEDDPWDTTPKTHMKIESVPQEDKEKDNNRIGEYNPWAIA